MNILDKVIGWVSPERALNRIAAREAIRQYDAASMDRLSSDWQPAYGTAEQLATGARDLIRGRARAAEMNSDLAESVVTALIRNVIGVGIKPQAKVRSGKGKLNTNLNNKIEKAWDKWTDAENADVRGLSNFYELQSIALRRMLYDGEILVNKTAQGEYLPLSIQLIRQRISERLAYNMVRITSSTAWRLTNMGDQLRITYIKAIQWGYAVSTHYG